MVTWLEASWMAEQEFLYEEKREKTMLHEWVYNGFGDKVCLHCGNSAGADATLTCVKRTMAEGEDIARAGAISDAKMCPHKVWRENCEICMPSFPSNESDRQVGGEHYMDMGVEPWDVIDTFEDAEFVGYHRGVALSYVMRAGRKGDIAEDFEKAAHHLMKAAEELRRRRDD